MSWLCNDIHAATFEALDSMLSDVALILVCLPAAFAFIYSFVLVEIEVTIPSPPHCEIVCNTR